MKRVLLTILMLSLAFGTVAAQTAKQHIAKGQEHMRVQNYAEAVASFDAAVKLQPKNKQASDLLRQAQEGRTEQMRKQADILFSEKNFTEAIVQYRAAQRYMPPGYKLGSQIASRLNEAQRALEDQQNQAQEHSARERAELARQSIEKANEHFLSGRYEDAIAEYENAVKIGGLSNAEVAESERLTNEAKSFMEKSDPSVVSRPLEQSDFDLVQNTNPGGVTILKYKGVQTKTVTVAGKSHSISYGNLDVVIPARLANQPVTIIGHNAFKDTGITSVTIPSSVREIQVGAFANNKLKTVTILPGANPREGLTAIKGGASVAGVEVSEIGAFENNPTLESIVIPNSVTEIGARAFKDCGLKGLDLSKATLLREIGESAFRNNQLAGVQLPPSALTIRRFAFNSNQIMAQVLPANIDVIFDNAFTNNPLASLVFAQGGNKWVQEYRSPNLNLNVPRLGGDSSVLIPGQPVFSLDSLATITLPAGMNTRSLDAFDPNLKVYYENRPPAGANRAQGTYIREMSGTTTIWSKR